MKLWHKALLLVMIPLLLELAFVAALVKSLQNLEFEYSAERTARETLAAITNQLRNLMEAVACLGPYGFQQGERSDRAERQLSVALAAIRAQQERLTQLNQGENSTDIQELNRSTTRMLHFLQSDLDSLLSPDAFEKIRAIKKAQSEILKFSESERKAVAAREDLSRQQQLKQAHLRRIVQAVVWFGIIFNTVLSIALIIHFHSTTRRRVDVLVDNARKLVTGEPLARPLTGSDELGLFDQTFHKMAAALEEAKQRQRALTENAADVICSTDEHGRFTEMNQAALPMWGYPSSDLIGKSIYTLLPEDQHDKARTAFAQALQENRVVNLELTLYRKVEPLCDTSWSVRFSPQQKQFFCVVHDISERKMAERLRQEVTAMVTHDLRAPITAMQGVLELLNEGELGELNERGKTSISRAQRSINRLVKLINDLLDIEKLQSGLFALASSEQDLMPLVRSAVESLHPAIERAGVDVQINGPNLRVVCDEAKLVRVITNLLDNAIKFSPSGSKIIIQLSENDASIRLEVIDEGCGIPAGQAERIFDRFFQLKNDPASGSRSGSGLGLAICKAIIDAHRGNIGVDTTMSRGSKFWFSLPKPSATVDVS